jgi:hypothetical protein
MNQRSSREVLEKALHNKIPEEINLLPRIASKFSKGRPFMNNSKRFVLAIVFVIPVFVAVLFFQPGIVAAMSRLFGYIPGLGIVVSDQSLYVLSDSVTMERNGVTVTVEKGVADKQGTTLRVSVKGTNADGGPYCKDPLPQLRLGNGKMLNETREYGNIGKQDKSEYTNLYIFPVLPVGQSEVTLEIPCLWRVSEPENWKIPLHFIPSNGNGINPVIEIPTDTPTEPPDGASLTTAPTEKAIGVSQTITPAEKLINANPNGISLTLDKVIPLDDGYLLAGNIHWKNKTVAITPHFDSIVASDSNGKEILLEEPADIPLDLISPDNVGLSYRWMYKVTGKQFAWPLTIKMAVDITQQAEASFTFDPGPNPHKGQIWTLDQDLPMNGYSLRVVSATWIKDGPPNGAVLRIEILSNEPDIVDFHVIDRVYAGQTRLCGGGGPVIPGKISSVVVYCETLTAAPRTLTIDSISLIEHGPWEVTWQP